MFTREFGGVDGIPLSYQERRTYHVHEYVDQLIGVADISEHLGLNLG